MKKNLKRYIAFGLAVLMTFSSTVLMQGSAREGDMPMLSGVFIATQLCSDTTAPNGSWDQSKWNTAADQLVAAGIDTMVVQYAVQYWSAASKTFYYPATFETPQNSGNQHQIRQHEYILKAAKAKGLKVYLGLHIAEDLWFSAMDKGFPDLNFLTDSVNYSKQVFDDLWNLYRTEYGSVIEGWYLPFEYNNSVTGSAKDRLINSFYAPLTSYIKSVTPSKLIMISPLIYTDLKPAANQTNLNICYNTTKDVYANSRVDIIAPQDGCGWESSVAENIGEWYAAMQRAKNDAQVIRNQKGFGPAYFWNNPECYSMAGAGMNMRRLMGNMSAVDQYVDKHVSFSIHSLVYLSQTNNADMENKLFYDAYKYIYDNDAFFVPQNAIPAPTGVSAVIENGYDVNLTWNAVNLQNGYMPIASYIVKRKRTGQQDSEAVKLTEAKQLYGQTGVISYKDAQIESGEGYEYLIYALDATGNISASPARVSVNCPETGMEIDRRYINKNFAGGLSVIYGNANGIQSADGSTVRLTDGQQGALITDWALQRNQWFGVQKQSGADIGRYSLTIQNIGGKNVGCVYVNALYQPNQAIYLPEKIDVYVNNSTVPSKTVYPQKQYQNSLLGDVWIPLILNNVEACQTVTVTVTQKNEWSFISEINLYEAQNTPAAGGMYRHPANIVENRPVAITGIGNIENIDPVQHFRGIAETKVSENGGLFEEYIYSKGLYATKNLTRDVNAPYVNWSDDVTTYSRWLGVGNVGTSFQLSTDLAQPSSVRGASLSFLQDRTAGIYIPKKVEFYADTGNGKLVLLGTADIPSVAQLEFDKPLSDTNKHQVEEKRYKLKSEDGTLYRRVVVKVFPQYPGNFSYMKDLIIN